MTTTMYSRRYQYQISMCHNFHLEIFQVDRLEVEAEEVAAMLMATMPVKATTDHSALRKEDDFPREIR
jgi:hypothetical protein